MDSINSSSNQHNEQQQQQFCLRWHNHQTSLLSTLPLLLDQSHLTDVTLSAEGKTLRAHRVVLSACSTYFSELFRTLDTNFHPIIVIPGASFAGVVALLTFMYSGEVNVYEEQIPTLLTLAETLGIKGLADFNHNGTSKSPTVETNTSSSSPQLPSIPSSLKTEKTELLSPPKMPSPLENFLMKSFQFYPSILNQPLNFSQSALNKSTEFLNKYHQQLSLMQQVSRESNQINSNNDVNNGDSDCNSLKRSNSGERKSSKDVIKKIDKIAENLRSTSNTPRLGDTLIPKPTSINSTPLILKPPPFSSLSHHFMTSEETAKINDNMSLEQSPFYSSPENLSKTPSPLITGTLLEKSPLQPKSSNSKLYATCFICHKQLSNQYNLRVHLETHQNVRYACNVCSHVSRSKDALRKHVSYRHPGVPSPCENEARRKRAKGLGTPLPLIKTTDVNNKNLSPQNFADQTYMYLQNQQQQQQSYSQQSNASNSQLSNISPSTQISNINESEAANEISNKSLKRESTNSE